MNEDQQQPPVLEKPLSPPPYDNDKVMTEAEIPPPPSLSVIEDYEEIAKKDMPPIEEETIEFKCVHWNVTDWNKLDHRVLGPVFQAGGHDWNVLMFPRGNNQSKAVSIYLDLTNAKSTIQPEEYACAQFIICLSKPSDPTRFVSLTAHHRFTSEESDWGFTSFVSFENLQNYIEQESVRVTVILRVVKDATGILWHNFVNYDSKKVTGYVGLQNQGATCYMNSLFQSLYFTNSFRKAVYQIPTENDQPTKSIALALQRVFYNLQFLDTAVGTTELTKSFGWDSLEAFRQHDVQEFNRVLQDNLEIKMKASRMKSYIKCINVDYESSRSEDYYDIQLNVKGCKNLEDSFKDYITEETLEGENKYMAEGYGLQDAKKGVIFESFPPVLHLQLKRFEYDMMRDMMVKINDRHEFPLEIDLEPYLAANADRSGGHNYVLHGVLVHSGDLTGGHYFAFVKPEKNGKWFKFDDDRVIPATLKEVLEENYGGEQTGMQGLNMRGRLMNRFTNAYMLVYIRECMMDEILSPVTETDIPKHLITRIEEEKRILEIKRKEKEEQMYYMKTLLATSESFKANRGFDFADFDERSAPQNGILVSRVRKDQTFGAFKADIAKWRGIAENEFRLWLLVNRQNRTVRLDMPIPDEEVNSTLDEVRQRYATNQATLRFYLEEASFHENDVPVFPPSPQVGSPFALIFIKAFSPEYQSLQGMGHIYAPKDAKIQSLVGKLKEIARLEESNDILVYEEIKPSMVDRIDLNITFTQAELQDGDILCVQRNLTTEEQETILQNGGQVTVDKYLEYELGKLLVTFAPRFEDDESPELELLLHRDMNYEQVAACLAGELKVSPDRLRVINPYYQGKVPQKRFDGQKLGKVLSSGFNNNQGGGRFRLLYEKLEMSLDEIESKCMVTVTVCTPTLKDQQVVELLLSKESTMKDLLEALVAKDVSFESQSGTRRVRIFDTLHGKFHQEYDELSWKAAVSERPFLKVYAEEVPEEEMNMVEQDCFIDVFHFQRITNHTHSVPFKFVLKAGEKLEDTKKRLQARTGLEDKEWNKVKINIVSEDELEVNLVSDDQEALFTASRPYQQGDRIGLDYIDKSTKMDRNGSGAIFIRG
ncbi:hypothetical protein G6F57_003257 [Rhizopus arrhizus]|nr:hypothetical protein G6F23_000304 [Rhizopus arrhizus]KAG0769634.1 hypothetical protein G6F24_000914 [Rhizopus arrhizus]KAG0793340.1 hypothetical protein G6F22_005629 [Rhizopus arrhizus]KAG0794010.1 hypothetical protein G6F21_003185 [Rhizopus arrhizus]KAG0818096.1 hypothetical protein G6F20_001846 [Rhizopus arrhizus]